MRQPFSLFFTVGCLNLFSVYRLAPQFSRMVGLYHFSTLFFNNYFYSSAAILRVKPVDEVTRQGRAGKACCGKCYGRKPVEIYLSLFIKRFPSFFLIKDSVSLQLVRQATENGCIITLANSKNDDFSRFFLASERFQSPIKIGLFTIHLTKRLLWSTLPSRVRSNRWSALMADLSVERKGKKRCSQRL
jgi:hypothetical protein